MNHYFLIFKAIILFYSIYSYIRGAMSNTALFIIAVLLIIAISFLIPVFKNKKVHIIFICLSIIIIFSFSGMFPAVLLFLPVLICELCLILKIHTVFTSILIFAGLPFSFTHKIESGFFLVSGLTLIVILLSKKIARIERLQSQNDNLRLRNRRLLKSVDFNEALKNQIAYTAQLEERNRIAQELHDKIGHSISGSLMQLEAIKLLTSKNPAKASEMLQKVVDTLRTGLDNIRITLRNIKPPPEQIGINHLLLMINEFKNKHHYSVSFLQEGDISKIKPVLWKIFHDNATEALTNILRHSQATSVTLSINVMNKVIRFQIKDNGHISNTVKKGLGLMGMEERLMMVHGSLIIDASDGFTLTMLVPSEG